MKLSDTYFFTLREDVKDEESKSGKLLVRAGMITKIGSGIYSFLPLGLKVLKNIENIVREEMNNAGAIELLMPSLIPKEYYEKSERAEKFGKDMFNLKDRYERNYVLGPTHEELFVEIAKLKVKSYKDLPFNLYQIANKYRDEMRPRFGLIRVREFIMKDAYSFDKDEEGLDISYNKMIVAYKKIMERLGIKYRIVRADTGVMGGTLSEEFQAICDIGEDTLAYCDNCDYSTNLEVGCAKPNEYQKEEIKDIIKIHTPDVKTIEDVSKFLNIPTSHIVKSLVYNINNKLYSVLIPGNYELNETKLSKLLNTTDIKLATAEEIQNINSEMGFVGPIGLSIPIIIDEDLIHMTNFVVGANIKDYHLKNVNIKDFKYDYIGDLKIIKEGDLCPKCGQKLHFTKGVEVANPFKLGTKYSEKLGLEFLDENNKLKPVVMGCYGIGIARLMTAIAEQNATSTSLNWPLNIAPYKVAIIPVNMKDEHQVIVASDLYEKLKNDAILDDRDVRVGVKFNDMELIGIPIQVIIGKNINENKIEIKYQNTTKLIDVENIIMEIENITKNQLL